MTKVPQHIERVAVAVLWLTVVALIIVYALLVLGTTGCVDDPAVVRNDPDQRMTTARTGSVRDSSPTQQQGSVNVRGSTGDRVYGAGDPWPFRLTIGGLFAGVVLFVVMMHMRVAKKADEAREKGYWEQRAKRLNGGAEVRTYTRDIFPVPEPDEGDDDAKRG